MFKNNFIKLCNERGESPSSVCRQVGIAPATFSCWTDESVPRKATLMRIADHFGVSVDYLLKKEEPAKAEESPSPDTNPAVKAFIDSLPLEYLTNSDLELLIAHAEFLASQNKNKTPEKKNSLRGPEDR